MKKSFVLYTDNYGPSKDLSDEQKARLYDAIFLYNMGETFDISDPVVKAIFSFFEISFLRDHEKWKAVAERNKNNGAKGGRPKTNNSNELCNNPEEPKEPSGLINNPENPEEPRKAVIVIGNGIVNGIVKKDLLSDSHESGQTKKQFKKPSIEEITIYCQERKNRVDPDKFFNFYESKGWMIGKNKMKNWRSAIITWEKGEDEKPGYRKNESNSLFNNNNGPEYAEL